MKKTIITNKNKTISEIFEFESSSKSNADYKHLNDKDLQETSKRVVKLFKNRKNFDQW